MIVGTSKIDIADLAHHTKSAEVFKDYCVSLVPENFRHIQPIISNQIYICCLYLRKCSLVDWSAKKTLISDSLVNVHPIGCTNELIDISDVLMYVER